MKQKLLNLFTWRATLLVALLCTAFGNAWGQTTSPLTFTVFDNQTEVEGIKWSATKGTTWSGTDNNVLTSSSITGNVKNVIVTAKAGHRNSKYKINVKVGNNDFGTKENLSGTSSTNTSFEQNSPVNVNDKTIEITITLTNDQAEKGITLEKIQVIYVSKATIPAPGALDKDAKPAKYYGTYSNKCQFVVPEGLTVSTVSVAGGELSVTDYNYDQDNPKIIPANTGVMISASNNSDTYDVDLKLATVPAIDGNMLRPTGDGIDNVNTVMSGPDPDKTYKFYYLTINSENDQIGFYRRNDTGAAFEMKVANKAYLAVPSGQVGNVKGYTFGDGTNGIKAVETEKAESNTIYNLAGQRVNKMQKGIYVVNGKKMLVK